MHRKDKYSQHSSIFWPVWLNGWVFVYELSDCCHSNFRCRVSSKEFLDIQETLECSLTLKCVRDMIVAYSHIDITLLTRTNLVLLERD